MTEFDHAIVKNPEIFQQNRLDPHSDHRCYASRTEWKREESSFMHSLNGAWKFSYAKNFELSPKDFFSAGTDCHGWRQGSQTADKQQGRLLSIYP